MVCKHNNLVFVEGSFIGLHNALHQLPTWPCPPPVFLCWHVHRYLRHACTPVSSHWQKYTQFALWPKNSTDVFQMQDKASFIELISKAWGNSPVTRLHSWLGIEMDIACELVTREIAGKQTTESLPDNTWKRKGPGTAAVCVGRQYVFIPLRAAFASLSPIGTWEDSRQAAVPLKSSQHVCLCQALACFRDYIFSFPFLNSPPRSPQRNSAETLLHFLAHTHIYLLKCTLLPCGEDYERLLGQFHP